MLAQAAPQATRIGMHRVSGSQTDGRRLGVGGASACKPTYKIIAPRSLRNRRRIDRQLPLRRPNRLPPVASGRRAEDTSLAAHDVITCLVERKRLPFLLSGFRYSV
ncbi:hypothetical protein MRX96_037705 [Rhipicephalus microplus]